MTKRPEQMKQGYMLSLFGGILIAASSVFEVIFILSKKDLSIFQEIVLTPQEKVFISLCIFLGLSAATLAFSGTYFLWKRCPKAGGFANIIGCFLALSNIVVPLVYDYEVSEIFVIGILFGFSLLAIGTKIGVANPSVEKEKGPILSSIEIAMVAVLSALYAVMIIVVRIPSPTGGYTHIGDIVVFVAALLFGYKVGGLVGVIGSVTVDFFVGYPRWFVSILAHGLEGTIPGLTKGKPFVYQVIACVIGGFLMATTYFLINIFIKGYLLALISYARDLFIQAGVSIVLGLILIKIIRRALPQIATQQ